MLDCSNFEGSPRVVLLHPPLVVFSKRGARGRVDYTQFLGFLDQVLYILDSIMVVGRLHIQLRSSIVIHIIQYH